MSRTALSVPRWAVITTFVLSLIGLGLSIYLTVAHAICDEIEQTMMRESAGK